MPGANRKLFHAAHYNVLAKRIREIRAMYGDYDEHELSSGVQLACDLLVKDLGIWFSEDNPAFEMDTWMEATNSVE